jgi:hypothetical protein
MRGACGDEAIGEVRAGVLGSHVQRLFHGGRVLELDIAAFEQRRQGTGDAGLVELVAAAQHPLGFEQGAKYDQHRLFGGGGLVDQALRGRVLGLVVPDEQA